MRAEEFFEGPAFGKGAGVPDGEAVGIDADLHGGGGRNGKKVEAISKLKMVDVRSFFVSQSSEHVQGSSFKLREGEPFFTEILEGCANMVDIAFVEDEESVVGSLESVNLDGRVLRVVFVEVESELLGYALGEDAGGNTFFSFGQEREDRVVDIVIN